MTDILIPKSPLIKVVVTVSEMKQLSYNGAYAGITLNNNINYGYFQRIRPNFTGFNDGDVCECHIRFHYEAI